MTNRDNYNDQELDDFINGESEINKIYSESESLSVPAHLEFSVKQLARTSLEKESTPQNNQRHSKTPGQRQYLIPLALVASVVIAVGLTAILFQPPPARIKVAQTPINNSATSTSDKSQTIVVDDNTSDGPGNTEIAQQSTQQIQMQRITSTSPVNVANDVKKTTIEKREQLVVKTDQSKTRKPVVPHEDIAQQSTYDIPPHISELLQNASANEQRLNGMPAVEVLRSWQKAQWLEQVQSLTKSGKRELAERYVAAFPEYFPNDSIEHLLQP